MPWKVDLEIGKIDRSPNSAGEAAASLGGVVSSTTGGSHLNGDDASEGTSTSGILAANKADIVLASNSTSALLVGGDGSGEREVGSLAISFTATSSGNVLGDLDVGPGGSGAVIVDHASVRASAVGVDLVESHGEFATGADLGENIASLGHDGLGAGLEVVVTGSEGLAKGFSGVTSESGGILLEGVSARAVSGGRGVNAESHARTAGVTSGGDNGTVSSDELGGEEDRRENGILERHFG